MKKLSVRFKRLFTKQNWNAVLELARANFRITDHNSILGVIWSLLVPLSLFLVMYFAFRSKFGEDIYAYPLFLLLGISCINFFITSSTYMTRIFYVHRGLISNSVMPRENLVVTDIFIHAYKFFIELFLCCLLSLFYGLLTWKSILLLIPLLMVYLAFTLGIGLIFSLVYCFTRDIVHIWMILSRFLLFATPIFYTLDSLSPGLAKIIYWLNPLTPFLISFREVLMGVGALNISNYFYSLFLGLGFFILGYYAFMTNESIAMERV